MHLICFVDVVTVKVKSTPHVYLTPPRTPKIKKMPRASLLHRRLCGFLASLPIFESNSELVLLWYHFFHRTGPREKRREK